MKQKLIYLFMSLGWVLLALFLFSGTFYNKLNKEPDKHLFSPISWDHHMQIFNGAIECTLSSSELAERKKLLKEKIFSKVIDKQEVTNGYIYYFDYDPEFSSNLFEFIEKEKACCPFFQFDLSILPFENGIGLQLSGSPAAFELLINFEDSEL